MFWKILLNENSKILNRKLFWVEIILMVLIVVGLLLALYITVETDRNGEGLVSGERSMLLKTLTWPDAWSNVIRFVGWDGFGPIFLIILVGAVAGQEYTWKTMNISLTHGIPRPLFLIAKLTALLMAGMLIVLAAVAIGGISTGVFSTLINGTLNINQFNLLEVSLSFSRAVYTLLPYGCLTLLLAVASRSTVLAISGGLLYVVVLETLITSGAGLLGERISYWVQYLPGGLANSLLALNNASLGMESSWQLSTISPLPAGVGIATWSLLFLGLSLIIFQRQDFAN
jgi:ABC-type transport system involved in multi-copper enzyme maturation permease subunit